MALQILYLERDLSESLTTEQWSQLQSYVKEPGEGVYHSVKQRQTSKFEELKASFTRQRFQSNSFPDRCVSAFRLHENAENTIVFN